MGSGGEGEKKAKIMEEEAFENKLEVKKLSEHATIPVRGSGSVRLGTIYPPRTIASSKKSKEPSKRTCPLIPKNT